MMNAFFSSPYYSITLVALAAIFVLLALLLLFDKKGEEDHTGLATRYFVIVLIAWLLIALYVMPSHKKEKKTIQPPANTSQKANPPQPALPSKPETDEEETEEEEEAVPVRPSKANSSAESQKNKPQTKAIQGSSPENAERIQRIRAGKK